MSLIPARSILISAFQSFSISTFLTLPKTPDTLKTMTTLRRYITLIVALVLFGLTIPAIATDFGNPSDVKQVRKAVAAKFGKVLNASVSHDWALCTAYSEADESDLSVVLHRTGSGWKVARIRRRRLR